MNYFEWNYLDSKEFHKNLSLDEWKKIRNKYPPSFLDVWLIIGDKKKKGYLDGPNKRWLVACRNTFDDKELKNVVAWKQIKSNSFAKQLKS